jgi:hypothetical protein
MKRRNGWVAVLLVPLLAYLLIAISPLKQMIGRTHPEIASLFSPFLFNFSASYDSGSVLGFHVNGSQHDVFLRLQSAYAGRSNLLVNCMVKQVDSIVPITRTTDVATIYGGGEKVCVSLDHGRVSLDFALRGTVVSRIDLAYIRSELP